MTQFTFRVDSLKARKVGTSDNVIESGRLIIEAKRDGVTRASLLPVQFDPPGDTFTPFEGLTEQQVIDWAVQKLGQSQIDAIMNGLEGVISDHLQSDQAGLKSVEPPWSS